MTQGTVGVTISLPISVVEKIDADRGTISRSRYFLELVERAYAATGEGAFTHSVKSRLVLKHTSPVVLVSSIRDASPK